MSSFKDLLQQDIDNVFLNDDEFAEKHKINGKLANIIIDDDELMEISSAKNESFQELYKNKKLIKLSESVLGGVPAIGSVIVLDAKRYTVASAMRESGMLTLILEAGRT